MNSNGADPLPSCALEISMALYAVRAAAHIVRDAPDEAELLWRALYTYLPTLMVQRLPNGSDRDRMKLVDLCKAWKVVEGELLVRSICSLTDDLVAGLPGIEPQPPSRSGGNSAVARRDAATA